ncbi:MAG: histidinol-phosphate transaminase [Bacteroidetes bacterium]|nr:histidinol-phosphate transaminase [Rhodothermia bacterium]MCS7155528.1 histidinol-phosphate transaminase [Bacteroidota bacterium]MCX7907379.1 histidinol-phosphate transaminase [Bacteroidota bacterium]MDW8138373.1 histidinol-phosphate transaminase [Bacteroidota bacterium]MDW8284690.1 histidinol-phosphate transaminase [Bacteroidota bacterium]
MPVATGAYELALARALAQIRPAVRALRPYRVEGGLSAPVKLNQNENPFDWPPFIKERVLERLRALPWNRYPEEYPRELTAALARHWGLEPDQVLVGHGSNELMYLVLGAVVRPGVRVLLPSPTFALYEKLVRYYEGDPVRVPLRPDGGFDVEAIRSALRRWSPALLVLVSPNSPTASRLLLSEVRELTEEAPGLVLVDEAYGEFSDQPSALTLLPERPHVLVLRTFSKAVALAGVRIGYLVGASALVAELYKAKIPFAISRWDEAIALAALEHDAWIRQQLNRLKAERERLRRLLADIKGVEVWPSWTNFVIFRTPFPATSVFEALVARGVLVRDVSAYPQMERCLRASVGAPSENDRLAEALQEVLQALGFGFSKLETGL